MMVDTTEIINAASIAVQKKLSIVTYTGKKEVSQTVRNSIAALMTSVNNPSVRHVTGNDKGLTIGRTIAFTSPTPTETMSSPMTTSPVSGWPALVATSIPGRIHIATQNDAAVTSTRKR